MKLPFANSKASTATNDINNVAKPTVSENTSTSQLEKDIPQTSSRSASPRNVDSYYEEKKVVEATPLDEAEALDKLDDEHEYPKGAKLGIITASLCLSVFLMALVSLELISCPHRSTDQDRTILSLRLQSLR